MKKEKKRRMCKHEFVLSGKYFGLICCPYCMKYFTKRIPRYWEEIREKDSWIEVKIKELKKLN